MKFFGWLAFLVALIVAVFAIQNSTLPLISVKLLVWQIETSPVYALLGAFIAGALIAVLLWIPYVVRESFRRKYLKKQIEVLQQQRGSEKGTEAKPDRPIPEGSTE